MAGLGATARGTPAGKNEAEGVGFTWAARENPNRKMVSSLI
jgi:hypothetical protein